jgi:hypothetical protein
VKKALIVLGATVALGCGPIPLGSGLDGGPAGGGSSSDGGSSPNALDAAEEGSSVTGGARVCQSVPAGLDGGWQLARFAKSHIAGKSASVEITLGGWQCSTARTDWTKKDTSSSCVDGTGTPHTLFLRSASFDPLCGNQNSCAWMGLSDTQDMPSFAGSDKGVNGYWAAGNYDGRANLFRVGIIDEYQDDLFSGSESAQDLYLSQSFTVCAQYPSGPSAADAGTTTTGDAGAGTAPDGAASDAPNDDGGQGTNPASILRTLVYHQITSEPTGVDSINGYEPQFSRNGARVAFGYGVSGMNHVVMVNPDGTGRTEVDRYQPGCYCASLIRLSDDGSLVAITDGVQIRVARTDGSAARMIWTSGEISSLAVARDPSNAQAFKIFFNLRRDATPPGGTTTVQRGVYAINPDGTGFQPILVAADVAVLLQTSVTQIFPFDIASDQSFGVSSDGMRLVVGARASGTGGGQAVIATTYDRASRRVLLGPVHPGGVAPGVFHVGLSGDGTTALYDVTVDATGNHEFGVVGFDGSNQRKVGSSLNLPVSNEEWWLSKDGSLLLAAGDPGYLIRTDGSSQLQLEVQDFAATTVLGGNMAFSTMSDDGRQVLYTFQDDNNRTQLAMLTMNPASLGPAPAIANPAITPMTITRGGSAATVTASVTSTDPVVLVTSALLLHGVDDWQSGCLAGGQIMTDDGRNGDAVAGDGVFTNNGIRADTCATQPGPRTVRVRAESKSSLGIRNATAVDFVPFAIQ